MPSSAAPPSSSIHAAGQQQQHLQHQAPDRLARASHDDLVAYAAQLERELHRLHAWGGNAERVALGLHQQLVDRTRECDALKAKLASASTSASASSPAASPPASPPATAHHPPPRVPDTLWLSAKLRAAETAVAKGRTERAALEQALATATAQWQHAAAECEHWRRSARRLAADNAMIAEQAAVEHAAAVAAVRKQLEQQLEYAAAEAARARAASKVPPCACALVAPMPMQEPPSPTADLHAHDMPPSPPSVPCASSSPAAAAPGGSASAQLASALSAPVGLLPLPAAAPAGAATMSTAPASATPAASTSTSGEPAVFDLVEALGPRGLRVHLAAKRRRRAATLQLSLSPPHSTSSASAPGSVAVTVAESGALEQGRASVAA